MKAYSANPAGEKNKIILLSVGIALVMGFAFWRISSANGPDPAQAPQTVTMGPDGKPVATTSSPAPSAPPAPAGAAGAGGTPPPPPADQLIDVPAYTGNSVDPFRSVIVEKTDIPSPIVAPIRPTFGDQLPNPLGDKAKAIPDPPKYVLQGVMSGDTQPIALIAEGPKTRLVYQGSTLTDGSRVMQIRPMSIVLRRGRVVTTLRVPIAE